MRLSELSSDPILLEYAQRLASQRIRSKAKFLAPTVEVVNPIGRFKKYDEKHRFRVPDTLRGVGGRAAEISFDTDEGTYNCQYHAIDVPFDKQEMDADDIRSLAMEGLDMAADVQALSHEKKVLETAVAALGSGTNSNFASADVDPVSVIDAKILSIMRATAGAAQIGIGFGPTAFLRFKENEKVRSAFKIGKGAGSASAQSITLESIRPLFMLEPQIEMFSLVEDTQPEGKARNLSFLLDAKIIVFARTDTPTRYDSSFMKTFRKRGAWMKPRIYLRDDNRVEVVASDWSEDVQVCNTSAGALINANNS